MIKPILLTTLAAALLGTMVQSSGAVSAEDPDLSRLADATLLTLEGESVRFGDAAGKGVVVVTYMGAGCPISGKYAPRLQRFADPLRRTRRAPSSWWRPGR